MACVLYGLLTALCIPSSALPGNERLRQWPERQPRLRVKATGGQLRGPQWVPTAPDHLLVSGPPKTVVWLMPCPRAHSQADKSRDWHSPSCEPPAAEWLPQPGGRAPCYWQHPSLQVYILTGHYVSTLGGKQTALGTQCGLSLAQACAMALG